MSGKRRLCAHADLDGAGMHWLEPGETCPRQVNTNRREMCSADAQPVTAPADPEEFPDLPERAELAHRLLVIRNIVAEVLDGEHGDRQLALERIGRVVVGDES